MEDICSFKTLLSNVSYLLAAVQLRDAVADSLVVHRDANWIVIYSLYQNGQLGRGLSNFKHPLILPSKPPSPPSSPTWTPRSPSSNAARQDPRPQAGHDAGTADRKDSAGMTYPSTWRPPMSERRTERDPHPAAGHPLFCDTLKYGLPRLLEERRRTTATSSAASVRMPSCSREGHAALASPRVCTS